MLKRSLLIVLLSAVMSVAAAPRARDLGVQFEGMPGPLNALTDVAGIEVGHSTIITDTPGDASKAVRTGVTVIFPRGKTSTDPVFGGWFPLNGNGELTGTHWLAEGGFLEGPIVFTGTHSVGVARDAVIAWRLRRGPDPSGYFWSLPVVGETWDGGLSDVGSFAVRPEHVWAALDQARGGAVAEGSVGGGTGMICYEFKGGIGTASRRLTEQQGGYTVGAIVQCNCGLRAWLTIGGVPVGKAILEGARRESEQGSILIVVATDAPLLPWQLERLARRAALGLGRTGSYSGHGSGDLMLAFSTANPGVAYQSRPVSVTMESNDRLDPLFIATAQAVEEAIINAMVAAPTMTGVDNTTVPGIPHERLRALLRAPRTTP
jgi:L-aminopeptidase/D-esterase-like protein